jgi:hypothetical protein
MLSILTTEMYIFIAAILITKIMSKDMKKNLFEILKEELKDEKQHTHIRDKQLQ